MGEFKGGEGRVTTHAGHAASMRQPGVLPSPHQKWRAHAAGISTKSRFSRGGPFDPRRLVVTACPWRIGTEIRPGLAVFEEGADESRNMELVLTRWTFCHNLSPIQASHSVQVTGFGR